MKKSLKDLKPGDGQKYIAKLADQIEADRKAGKPVDLGKPNLEFVKRLTPKP